jgi:hypothetical protein
VGSPPLAVDSSDEQAGVGAAFVPNADEGRIAAVELRVRAGTLLVVPFQDRRPICMAKTGIGQIELNAAGNVPDD